MTAGRPLRILLCLLLATVRPGAAEDRPSVAAVLSSDAGPYREAFAAFRKEWGRDVPVIQIEDGKRPKLPAGAKTVVAFGGKAALAGYPADVGLVYCLSPAAVVPTQGRKGTTGSISLIPRPDAFAAQLKALQPKMRRLGVLWTSPSFEEQMSPLKDALAAVGIDARVERLKDKDQLPESLRRFLGGVDAIWVPPDPALINEQTLLALKEFSWGNRVPFYAPTGGLVEAGAVAAVSVTFSEIGRAAAAAAREGSSGVSYVERVEVVLNLRAAQACGLAFPPEAIKKAARVIAP